MKELSSERRDLLKESRAQLGRNPQQQSRLRRGVPAVSVRGERLSENTVAVSAAATCYGEGEIEEDDHDTDSLEGVAYRDKPLQKMSRGSDKKRTGNVKQQSTYKNEGNAGGRYFGSGNPGSTYSSCNGRYDEDMPVRGNMPSKVTQQATSKPTNTIVDSHDKEKRKLFLKLFKSSYER